MRRLLLLVALIALAPALLAADQAWSPFSIAPSNLTGSQHDHVTILSLDSVATSGLRRIPLGQLRDLRHAVSLGRPHSPYQQEAVWHRASLDDLGHDSGFLLGELEHGGFVLVVPLIDLAAGSDAALHPTDDGGIELVVDSGSAHRAVPHDARVLAIAYGDDPYLLCQTSAAIIASTLNYQRNNNDPLPPVFNRVGWRHSGTADDALNAISAIRNQAMPLGWCLLGDGWQHSIDGRLIANGSGPQFGTTLADFASQARSLLGDLGLIAEQHLLGDWHGCSQQEGNRPTQPQALSWPVSRLLAHGDANRRWPGPLITVPLTAEVPSLWHDISKPLIEAGFNGLAVHGQALSTAIGNAPAWLTAVDSICTDQDWARINIMGHDPLSLYHGGSGTLTRVDSNELDPQRLARAAIFNLWYGHFTRPDWGTLHSNGPTAAAMACAIALNGGPLCLSDSVADIDSGLLRQLLFHDGRPARCRQPARPAFSSLFADPARSERPIAISNTTTCGWAIAAFDSRPIDSSDTKARGATLYADDLPIPDQRPLVVHRRGTAHVSLLSADQPLSYELTPAEHALFSGAAIVDGMAVFGIDELCVPGSAVAGSWPDADGLSIDLHSGGTLIIYFSNAPQAVIVNDQIRDDWHYHAASGTLRLALAHNSSHRIRINR
ncbi:MAG: Sip1-related alpha-galactosidase [Planctomycetota bacterium]|jgi:hypothetical protein